MLHMCGASRQWRSCNVDLDARWKRKTNLFFFFLFFWGGGGIDLDGLPNPNNFKVIFPQNYLSQNVLVCDLIDTMEWKEDLIEGSNLPMCIISMLEACYKIKVQFLPYKKSKHHLSLSLSLSAIYIYIYIYI